MQDDCKANAKRLQSDCKAIAKRLQSDYCKAIIAKRLQSDYCKAIVKRLYNEHIALENPTQSDRKTFAKK
jgi:hypothetical protein